MNGLFLPSGHARPASRLCTLFVGTVTAVALCLGHAFAEIPHSRTYELIRPLAEPPATNFVREWLLCGEFPNPPHPGQKSYNHTPPCVGFDTDYLSEQGGEEGVRPREGMKHTRPDGTVAEWFRYESDADQINLEKIFKDRGRPTDNALAYGFTTLFAETAERRVLALGSDDGVMVWVNGKQVHYNLVPRAAQADQDLIVVDLQPGENRVLLKVENGNGRWGFIFRTLPAAALTVDQLPFAPVRKTKPGDPLLTIETNSSVPVVTEAFPPVLYEVVRAGGEVVTSRRMPYGQSVSFKTNGWPAGTYEVRCTLGTERQRQRVVHLPWVQGNPRELGKRLAEAAAAADPNTVHGQHLKVLEALARDRAGDLANLNADGVLKAHSALMEFEELEQGSSPGPVRPYGFLRLGYRDEVDGTTQFARVYLPADYTSAKRWPLVVALHGYIADSPDYVKWPDVGRRHHPWTESYGLILLEPQGRYNSWYKGIGITDVLRSIDLVKQRLPIDEDRVYLTGYSMGGGGVWEIGTRYPELFAGLAPVFGGWDDRLFLDQEQQNRLTQRQQFEAEAYGTFSRAESLLTTPVFINQGTNDPFVDVGHARYIVRMLQQWGYPVRYWEHRGRGHDRARLGHQQAMLEWLLQQRRIVSPKHVRVRSPDLKYAAAHWVRVERRADPRAFVYVEAEIVAPQVLRIRSQNVLALTLSPGPELLDATRPVSVDWNGKTQTGLYLRDGRLTLRDPQDRPGPLAKRPQLAGPLNDVWTTPFIIVVGTLSPDPQRRLACQWRARRLVDHWRDWYHAEPRVVEDVSLAPEDFSRYSLILLGGPEENAATAQVMPYLPVTLAGDTVAIGNQTFAAPDSLLRMIYPHPMNLERYVVLTAATSARAMRRVALTRDAQGFAVLDQQDFYLLDCRVADPDADRPDEKVCRVSGRFDRNWQIREELLVRGDANLRQRCPEDQPPPFYPPLKQPDPAYLDCLPMDLMSGGFLDAAYGRNMVRQPLELDKKRYTHGLGLSVWGAWEKKSAAEWDLTGGGWQRLLGVVGLQLRAKPEQLTKREKDDLKVRLFVKGDGKELFKTDQLKWNSSPVTLEVPLTGVKRLRIEVINEGGQQVGASSVNLADLRLTRGGP